MGWNGWDWAVLLLLVVLGLSLLAFRLVKVWRRRTYDHPAVTDEMVARHPSSGLEGRGRSRGGEADA